MTHPALTPGAVAVITGGASGIGLAAAARFAALGLRVCIADLGVERLAQAASEIAALVPGAELMTSVCDVSRLEALQQWEGEVIARFGGVDVLMNNAGIQRRSRATEASESWEQTLAVNLWGAIYGTQTFAPGMMARKRPGLIINTGSKQGITTPPETRPTTSPRRRSRPSRRRYSTSSATRQSVS